MVVVALIVVVMVEMVMVVLIVVALVMVVETEAVVVVMLIEYFHLIKLPSFLQVRRGSVRHHQSHLHHPGHPRATGGWPVDSEREIMFTCYFPLSVLVLYVPSL